MYEIHGINEEGADESNVEADKTGEGTLTAGICRHDAALLRLRSVVERASYVTKSVLYAAHSRRGDNNSAMI